MLMIVLMMRYDDYVDDGDDEYVDDEYVDDGGY